MSAVFAGMPLAGAALAFVPGLGVWAFTAALFVLAVGMGVGKAGVYKWIAEAFPKDVGAVGGIGGALGGVLVPLGTIPLQAATGKPQMLLGLTAVSTVWFVVNGLASRTRTETTPAPQAATA